MRFRGHNILLSATLLWALAAGQAQASYVTVDAFGLTTSAHYGTTLNLPQMSRALFNPLIYNSQPQWTEPPWRFSAFQGACTF